MRQALQKLPDDLQRNWQSHALKCKADFHVDYPTFHELADFVQRVAEQRNDSQVFSVYSSE
jgi:hypothetical protein